MADHFLSKIRVAPEDFVEAGGSSVLERFDELRALLNDRAGPEVADLFAEPLISRGNDAAPPTVSWYTGTGGDPRPLGSLSPGERERAEMYLADHLRPLRALADDPATADLALGALSVYGQDDIMVVGTRPVIVNWGLLPGGKGANISARSTHYETTLGKYLPLHPARADAAPAAPAAGAAAVAGGAAAGAAATQTASAASPPGLSGDDAPVRGRAGISPIAWVPLVILLVIAGLVLAWLLMPGTRLFQVSRTPPAVTDAATLSASRALNEALRARKKALEDALAGAVCRADGELILPGGRTPEGLLPPPLGTLPERKSEAVPDALLPNRADRVLVPDPAGADDANAQTTLLELIETRTVLVLAAPGGALTAGSGFIVGPGLILTNQHVIEGASGEAGEILVTSAALGKPQLARVLKSQGPLIETGGDFALLQIEGETPPALMVYLSPQSLKLTNVVAAGFPGDVLEMDTSFAALRSGDLSAVPSLTVTDGTVNTEQQIGPETHVLMHSAPLSSGNSGGPLVDMCGRLVGVNTFVRQGKMQNRGFALTTGDMMAFLKGTPAAPAVVSDPCAPIVVRPQVAAAPAGDAKPAPAPDKPAPEKPASE